VARGDKQVRGARGDCRDGAPPRGDLTLKALDACLGPLCVFTLNDARQALSMASIGSDRLVALATSSLRWTLHGQERLLNRGGDESRI